MFGREQELGLLREQWSQAAAGEGKAVLLLGEAGIGKSRLIQALADAIEQPCFQIRYQCSPYYRDSPLFPVVRQLRHAAQIAVEDADETKLDKLERLLNVAVRAPEATSLLADLLGFPTHSRYPPIDISPQLQRMQTLSVLIDQLLGLAALQPVLVLVEDVHWIDPTTLEMLELGLDRIARSKVMMVFTSRRTEHHRLRLILLSRGSCSIGWDRQPWERSRRALRVHAGCHPPFSMRSAAGLTACRCLWRN